MPDTLMLLKNRTEPRLGQLERSLPAEGTARPAWVIAILASVLIFTTVVDVLGNLLVIISVFRNRKLRNAGEVFIYFFVCFLFFLFLPDYSAEVTQR